MGTNYYAYNKETKEKLYHIGKRSAAGHYCWDCGITYINVAEIHRTQLYSITAYHRPTEYSNIEYIYGSDAVHIGGSINKNKLINNEPQYLDCCPICGKPKKTEAVNSAYAELGFSKQPTRQNNTTCSFSFAISPYKLSQTMKDDDIGIMNEYDKELSKEEFKEILQNCGLKYFHSVGQEFS